MDSLNETESLGNPGGERVGKKIEVYGLGPTESCPGLGASG